MQMVRKRYELMDGCYGTVTGLGIQGAIITLDNGEDAFAYGFANLPIGSKVLCTVTREGSRTLQTEVSVDSVRSYAAFAA